MRKKPVWLEKALKGIRWFKKNGVFLKAFLECANILTEIIQRVFSSCIFCPQKDLILY